MYEVTIIQHIQSIQNAFLDAFFSVITALGDELFFIVVAVALYWCVNKRLGFKLINVYLLGCACIEGIKGIVARPRPYNYEGIISIGKETSGFSFPSGHSHSISNLSTQICMKNKRSYLYIFTASICLLVAFSRLYLGQHFLSDVIVGLALGIGFAFLFSLIFELMRDREEYIVLGIFPICMIILLIIQFTGNAGSLGNVMNVLGGYSAVALGYFLEKRYVKFNVKTKWYFQVLKIVIGLALLLGVKEGLKLFIPMSIPILYNFVRYFVTALVGVLGVPLLFKILRLYDKNDAPTENQAVGETN